MKSVAVVALAVIESAAAFQAPALKASTRAVGATMFAEGDIGVLPPLGVFDPLGLISSRDMKRYEIMEIKHGRAAMMAITGFAVQEFLYGKPVVEQTPFFFLPLGGFGHY